MGWRGGWREVGGVGDDRGRQLGLADVSALDFYVHWVGRLLRGRGRLGLLAWWELGVGSVVAEGVFVLLSGICRRGRRSGRLVDVQGALHHHGQTAVVGALVRSVEVTDQVRAGDLPELWGLVRVEVVIAEVLAIEVLHLALDGRGWSLRLRRLRLRSVVGWGEGTNDGTLGGHHRRHHLVLRSLRRHHVAHHAAIVVAVLGLRAHQDLVQARLRLVETGRRWGFRTGWYSSGVRWWGVFVRIPCASIRWSGSRVWRRHSLLNCNLALLIGDLVQVL